LATISANPPSIGNVLAQLIASSSSAPPAPAAASTSTASSSAAPPSAGSGAAVFVTLSDQAKAAAATKAQSDSDAADRLQAFVDQQRANNASAAKAGAPVSLQNILETNSEAADTPPASSQPTPDSKVEVIVAQIKTLAAANEPPPFQPFVPSKSLSNSLTVDGFTLTVETNASTQFYGTELTGNGTQVYDKHFGQSDEAGGGTGAGPGVSISTAEVDNNEALDAVTVTRNIATASSASVSSSSAGSISTSSVNAQSSSITFLVNYATGQISAEGSAASVSARSSSVGTPGSTLSTLA
jgi:ATPase subunit of ABC transporter with duplicated ATPase domains